MFKNNNTAVEISNLSKRYLIGKKKDGSLRGTLSSIFKTGNAAEDEFWALKDINLNINKGDVIGIIGKNGAGKSTLLKILSQITQPTTGRIEINGRVASLLEVGTGFHPELTGRENIYLNGTILGMTRKEVTAKFDEIVAFSGIEKFIDTPVKRYSSGMYVRLAFSVAAHLEPEILIIDEVLAVGDAEFQEKCLGKMKDVAGEGRTVIFVSHDMGAVTSLCNKGVFLNNGTIELTGEMEKIVSYYLDFKKISTDNKVKYKQELFDNWDKKIQLIDVTLIDENNVQRTNATVEEKIGVKIDFINIEGVLNPIPNIHLSSSIGSKIGVFVNPCEKSTFSKKGNHSTTMWIPKHFLNSGQFTIGVAISTLSPVEVHVADYNALSFEIIDNLEAKTRNGYTGKIDGFIRPDFMWDNK